MVTNTQGVDLYKMTYENHCTHDGALQTTARFIDSLGFNSTSEDPFLPNAAVLRSAEAADAIANAARSGTHAKSPTESAGLILCSIVRKRNLNRACSLLSVPNPRRSSWAASSTCSSSSSSPSSCWRSFRARLRA